MRKNFGAKPWLYPQPVLIIATYGEEGTPDAMNAASLNPPVAPCNGRTRNWRASSRRKDAGKATTLS